LDFLKIQTFENLSNLPCAPSIQIIKTPPDSLALPLSKNYDDEADSDKSESDD